MHSMISSTLYMGLHPYYMGVCSAHLLYILYTLYVYSWYTIYTLYGCMLRPPTLYTLYSMDGYALHDILYSLYTLLGILSHLLYMYAPHHHLLYSLYDMHSMISCTLYMWWWMHPVYVCVGAPLIYVLRTLYTLILYMYTHGIPSLIWGLHPSPLLTPYMGVFLRGVSWGGLCGYITILYARARA